MVIVLGNHMDMADLRHGEPSQVDREAAHYVPDLSVLSGQGKSEMREIVEHFVADRDALLRYYDLPYSVLRMDRLSCFYASWLEALDTLPYNTFSVGGRIDWHMLHNKITHMMRIIERERALSIAMEDLMPITEDIAVLHIERRTFERRDASCMAEVLTQCAKKLKRVQGSRSIGENQTVSLSLRQTALKCSQQIKELRRVLEGWYSFYDGYDPHFSWWNRVPYNQLMKALDEHDTFLCQGIIGMTEQGEEPILGDPVGALELEADLTYEMIPYSPDELISMAHKELDWCMAEWSNVARDMGLGNDWKAALKASQAHHTQPGEQPSLIAWQAYEAINYVKERDLLTVPALAIDVWRMSMMSPQAQKTNPFFLGGEELRLSFPTDTMTHDEKYSSLRANNIHLTRATVHHELIPGHHLQMFALQRFNPYRRFFNTPFWIEGWALWWEFLLWDMGFPTSPENRAGLLFWRTHRCARIVFSLNFHMGNWTPSECIDFLVETVGHDVHTATGEVRRSFNGNYPPLYQAAYMIGAMQVRALYQELVVNGIMSLKEFHDGILLGGMMPLELCRANLKGDSLPKEYRTSWRFAGPL